jgi:hypothetical protein
VLKSAATIALISVCLIHQLVVRMCPCNELMSFLGQLAVAGIAATAGAALLPEATVIAGVSLCSLSIHAIVAMLTVPRTRWAYRVQRLLSSPKD